MPAPQQVGNAFCDGGRSPRWRAIDVEVFGGRHWRPVASSDGIVVLVSQMRPRTLANRGGAP
jgi:hypothetical protein